jgi:acyl-coenzyme A synthetase/AMP-(fatty) acid ligase
MIGLARLLEQPADGSGVVAFGGESTRTRADLGRDVASLATSLTAASGGRILLHCEDTYAFAVGLLAIGQVGARALLPPSRQPEALRRLPPDVAGSVLDGAPPHPLRDRPVWHPLEAPRVARELVELDRDAPWVEMFTSGTTGTGRAVSKAVRHLEDEVAVLEASFGAALGPGTRLLATVAPQHLYGLLFRVLWPLAAGRPFLSSPVLHPEELEPHAGEGSPFALASTPVALRYLVSKGVLRRGASACRAVFSSGGPLSAELAAQVAEHAGVPPFEIYGSTETGGVAARQRCRGDEPWRPLPGVDLAAAEAGTLVVTSPFVSEGTRLSDGRRRFALDDLAAFDTGGGFQLLGRTDRVVKVGDKRLALPSMEARLVSHPAVAEAALVALESSAGDTRVGAVVVPTPAGDAIARAGGRRALTKVLSEHLAGDFDRVLLPRAWRLVAALPGDAQGKLPAESLVALFENGGGLRPFPAAAVRRSGRRLEARLRLPRDSPFLEGHFPGAPVVAGVVQLHFAMQALEELLGAPPRLAALEALKFREVLLPEQSVVLRLDLDEDGERFAFSLEDPDAPGRVFTSGRGRLGGPA